MGMFNRLLRRDVTRASATGLDIETARGIVQDYKVFLETSAPMPGRVADVSELPHSKDLIKDAISVCITVLGDPQLTEHLKYGYLMLSAWQNGVGASQITNQGDVMKSLIIAVALVCACTDSRAVVWPDDVQHQLDEVYDRNQERRQRERIEDRAYDRRQERLQEERWEEQQDHNWEMEDYYDD